MFEWLWTLEKIIPIHDCFLACRNAAANTLNY
jgi:hypothetical protein